MADSKLSALDQLTGLIADAVELYVNSNGSSKKVIASQIRDYVSGLKNSVALTDSVATVVESFLVDDYQFVRWNLVIRNASTKEVEEQWYIDAWHDGTTLDATEPEYTIYGVGPSTTNEISVDLNDSGASQVIRLLVTADGTGKEAVVHRELVTPTS